MWYNEPTIIVAFWSGDISAEDMESFADAIRVLLADAEAPLYVLVNTADVVSPYMNMGTIRSTMRGIMDDERVALWLAYGVTNAIVNFLLTFVSRAFSLKVRTFETWQDAQDFLEGLDTGLDFSRRPAPSAAENSETG